MAETFLSRRVYILGASFGCNQFRFAGGSSCTLLSVATSEPALESIYFCVWPGFPSLVTADISLVTWNWKMRQIGTNNVLIVQIQLETLSCLWPLHCERHNEFYGDIFPVFGNYNLFQQRNHTQVVNKLGKFQHILYYFTFSC